MLRLEAFFSGNRIDHSEGAGGVHAFLGGFGMISLGAACK